MIKIPEDFHLRAKVMLKEDATIDQYFEKLKSFEHKDWTANWEDLAKKYHQSSINTLKEGIELERDDVFFLKKQCAALAIACYPYLSTNQRLTTYQKLKRTYQELCIAEGYAIEYHTIEYNNVRIPFTIRQAKIPTAPLILIIRGLDSFKEVRYWEETSFLENGYSIASVDFPGMGENPLPMTINSEEFFIELCRQLKNSPNLKVNNVVCWGLGFGGYWAQKIASVPDTPVSAAINQGGPVHYGFSPNLKKLLFNFSEIKFLSNMVQVALNHSMPTSKFINKLSLRKQQLTPQKPLLYINGDQDLTASKKEFDMLTSDASFSEYSTTLKITGAGHLAIDALDSAVLPHILDWLKSLKLEKQIKKAN